MDEQCNDDTDKGTDNAEQKRKSPSQHSSSTSGESYGIRESEMTGKMAEGTLIISSQFASCSSGYSSDTADVSTTPPAGENKKSTSRKRRECTRIRELKPSPYFYYIDHSRDVDDNLHVPLLPALSVPNFVIKLHAILVCDSLSDTIGWMPHGRSWKILNQPAFEKRVLPKYFNQSSIASFYRQANGWGFRCMLKGPDKGSFYNERFIRGLPFLCKKMKRIGSARIVKDININHEPNLWKISAEHPPPQNLPMDSFDYIVLSTINKCIEEGGPKAKMPLFHGMSSLLGNPTQNSTTTTPTSFDQVASMSEGSKYRQLENMLQLQSLGHQNQNIGLIPHQVHRQHLQLHNQHAHSLLSQELNERAQNGANLAKHLQPQVALSQIDIDNILKSTGQYSVAPSPFPAAATPSLGGNVGDISNAANLMGLNVGRDGTLSFSNASIQRERENNILRQAHISRAANLALPPHMTSNSRLHLNNMLQKLTQNQAELSTTLNMTQRLRDIQLQLQLQQQFVTRNQLVQQPMHNLVRPQVVGTQFQSASLGQSPTSALVHLLAQNLQQNQNHPQHYQLRQGAQQQQGQQEEEEQQQQQQQGRHRHS